MELPGDELDEDRVDVDVHSVNDSVHKAVLAPTPVAGHMGRAVRWAWRVTCLNLQLHLVQKLGYRNTLEND